jgi:hypothetical protein
MMKNYLFLILTAPLVILIILALPGKRSFRFSGEAVLEQIGQKTHIISVHKFKELKDGEPGIQLVDLRGANEFADGHLPDAVNMPVEKTYQADKYWILFRQMGIENLYVLETGPVLDSLIMNWDSESSRRILVDEDPTFTFQPDTSINH